MSGKTSKPQSAAEFIGEQIELADSERQKNEKEAEKDRFWGVGAFAVGAAFSLASIIESRKVGSSDATLTISKLGITAYTLGVISAIKGFKKSISKDRFENRVNTLTAHRDFAGEEVQFQAEEGYRTVAAEPPENADQSEESGRLEIVLIGGDNSAEKDEVSLKDKIASKLKTSKIYSAISTASVSSAALIAAMGVDKISEEQGKSFIIGSPPEGINTFGYFALATGIALTGLAFAGGATEQKDEAFEMQTGQIADQYRQMREQEAVPAVA